MSEKEKKTKRSSKKSGKVNRKELMWKSGSKEWYEESNAPEAEMDDLRQKLRRVELRSDAPSQINGEISSLESGEPWSLNNFREAFRLRILTQEDEETGGEIVLEMKNVDAAIVNAVRRILLAEVPTMAIETVYIENNTSVMQDEVLAHRLGLVPLKADPRRFQTHKAGAPHTALDTLVFTLEVQCKKGEPETERVYSRDLRWVPQEEQRELFEPDEIRPVHPDILLLRMRPGQCVRLKAFAQKGIGRTHAKWSPVATASYRLLPEVTIRGEVRGEAARTLVDACPMGVFDLEDVAGTVRAKVVRPRNCTMCRECLRAPGPEIAKQVRLARVKDHFVFQVESTGILPPRELVREALQIFAAKAAVVQQHLYQITRTQTPA